MSEEVAAGIPMAATSVLESEAVAERPAGQPEPVRGLIVLSAGFSETGPAGKARQWLVESVPEVVELDLNPVVALAVGCGAIPLDARIRIRR